MESRDLEITLLSAMDLNRVNLITKMDVYAVVSIYGDNNNNQRIKTPVDHQGDANPNWNFTIKFKIDDAALQMNRLFLDIKFICERTLGDKDVGQVNIPIKELLDSQPKSAKQIVRYQVIKPNGKPKGQIAFIYEFSQKIASTSEAPPGKAELEHVAAYPFGSISGYPQPGTYPPYSVESGSGHFPPYPAVAGSYPPQAPYPKADGNGNYPPPSSYPKTDGIGGYPKTDENVSYPPPSSYPKTDGNGSYPPPYSYAKTDGNGSYAPPSSYPKTDGSGSYPPPSSYPKTDGSGSYPPPLSYANPYPKADGSGSYPPVSVSVSPYSKTDGNGGFTYAGGYPQPHPAGYGYPPPGYPPQAGYGYPQQAAAAAAAPKKNKFGGLGLGTGLLGGAIGGLLVGDMISDAADFDSGGFDF